ncbi:MAG TPA: hypothetical protein VKQ29_04430 [Aliidongia sp.]|nr:hypothetical protein [Aliidongia sp.]
MAALDAACAWLNPALVLAAVIIALLDLAGAAQRWRAVPAVTSVSGSAVIVTTAAEAGGCAPVIAPELHDMMGRD